MSPLEIVTFGRPKVRLGIDFDKGFTYLAVTILSDVTLSETPATGLFWIGL